MKTLTRINTVFNSNLKNAQKSTESAKGKTIRGYIKQLLDRESLYSPADYVRKIRKLFGTEITVGRLTTALNRMEKDHQLRWFLIDGKLVGFTR